MEKAVIYAAFPLLQRGRNYQREHALAWLPGHLKCLAYGAAGWDEIHSAWSTLPAYRHSCERRQLDNSGTAPVPQILQELEEGTTIILPLACCNPLHLH